MVFSSHIFIFYFLPLALLAYYVSPRRLRHLTLTLFSYVFYGWANPYFVVLMLVSTLIDYLCGLVLMGEGWRLPKGEFPVLAPGGERTRRQRIAVTVSVMSNLSLLGFFKYFNFGIENYIALARSLGLEATWDTAFRVTLPLGISFYTFQSMSYAIDVYRGNARAIRSFVDFACYVSMFPQLVAGPIVRFQEIADQLRFRTHTLEKCARGVAFFSCGLAKKILLANACGKIADTCFDSASVSVLDAWYGLCAYAFQIYFDFSGYSDMAIGLGLFFGFVFSKNFDSPYKADSMTDFWRRWHVSLSTWLRDYLYIPLGGNRKGRVRTYINLALTMLLGGLWHGASWNFVIWGGIHGGWLSFERAQGKESFYARLPRFLRIAITFLIVNLAWVFFRAKDLSAAMQYLQNMVGLGAHAEGQYLVRGLIYQPYYVVTFLMAAAVTWGAPQTWDFTRRLTAPRIAWCLGLLFVALIVMSNQAFNPFIYFIF